MLHHQRLALFVALIFLSALQLRAEDKPHDVQLQQIVPRESISMIWSHASLTVGRDGLVYLAGNGVVKDTGFLLRLNVEGKEKFGKAITYANGNATANADGMVASSHAHFAHKVVTYNKALEETGAAKDFLVNDSVSWDAPACVEAGESGDFYGLDQHRDRIVRISPNGQATKTYSIPREPKDNNGTLQSFRVFDKKQLFYVVSRNNLLRCVGFDGVVKWSHPGCDRAWDVDADGCVYMLSNRAPKIKVLGADGKPLPEITLQMAEHTPAADKPWFHALQIAGGNVLIRSASDTEIFQCYDLKSGAFKRAVNIDQDTLTVTFPSLVWTAGQSIPFAIRFDPFQKPTKPVWHVWARSFDAVDYRELKVAGDKLDVPADMAGLYRIKVTPELQPIERYAEPFGRSEYIVETVVEVRTANAKGSVTICTQDDRSNFAQGDAINFSAIARGRATTATLRLISDDASATVIAELKADLKADGASSFAIPTQTTTGLRPGAYILNASAEGMTCAAQRITVGPTFSDSPFFYVRYGDYGGVTSFGASVLASPDIVWGHADTARRFGLNLNVDRIGSPISENHMNWTNQTKPVIEALAKRLDADPLSVASQRARLPAPMAQTLAAYEANGLSYMPILMNNDAGLPLGSGYDNRKPDDLKTQLTKITQSLLPFESVRGWIWSSNWWVFGSKGAGAAKTPDEKKAYEVAIKAAKETGAWDPILDKVSGYRLGYAVEAQDLLASTLKTAAPERKFITSVAAPYRQVEAYPPITFSNVDEVDLHIQWEQMAVPYHGPHNVDYYKRPGKRGWTHPEVWNDDGTGGQFLSVLMQQIMRGADGVGFSGGITPWATACVEEPRSPHFGFASVVRAFGGLVKTYGPLFAALKKDDRVAIVASGRMYRIDEWKGVMGQHFARQMEAYVACLHAHHPASIIFAEDVKTDTLAQYKAMLLVDERVELEPELLTAIRAAKASGTTVLCDGNCRPALIQNFTALGLTFNKFEADRSPAGDDEAYWRFAAYAKASVPVLSKALDAATPSPATTDDDQVLLSQLKGEGAQYLFVVNNTVPRIDPGYIWRTNLAVTTRVPLVAPLKINTAAKAIYDVFAMKLVSAPDGTLQADLRNLPAKLYALLPAAVAQITANAPKTLTAGQRFSWSAQIQDDSGKPLAAIVPVRVRLLAADGAVLAENFVAAGSQGVTGVLSVPLTSGNVTLEAIELLSGKTALVPITVTAAKLPTVIADSNQKPGKLADPVPFDPAAATAGKNSGTTEPIENSFGPHLRDVVISPNGKLAVMNAMNWDHNLYALDLQDGKVAWRQRAGHYFAFAPQALTSGFAVQGFDYKSAEGYHLYLVGDDGKFERRFALYGVPVRLPFRFVPGLYHDRNNNFATPADGSWIAAAGDLGLAVWSRDGKLLWSQDWWKTARHTAALKAIDASTLVVVEGMNVTAYAAADGKKLWNLPIACPGQAVEVLASRDGKTLAVLASLKDGAGRCYIVREGKLDRTIPEVCDAADIAPDASSIAIASGCQLQLHSLSDGLQWTFLLDEHARFPKFSPDGKRIAVSSDNGSAYVLESSGKLLWEHDTGARAAPAWLPNGDLLLAGWEGTVARYASDFKELWRVRVQPEETDMREKLLADDGTPSVRMPAWGNAEATPLAITPNALAEAKATIKFVPSGNWGGTAGFVHDAARLINGKNEAPPSPWIDWSFVGFFSETSPINYILFEAPGAQIKLRAVTLFEDPAHPESWLRDGNLEFFDTAKNLWVPVQPLLSNSAIHTHKLSQPVEASKFRILLPWGVVGNLRLAQIVFHGDVTAAPHLEQPKKPPAK